MTPSPYSLRVLAPSSGSVEWRLVVALFTVEHLTLDLLGLLVVGLPAALWAGWRVGLAAGVLAALGSLAFRALLAVQYESLTYVRLLGVQLTTRRRCGLFSGTRFLPLRRLQNIIIHEELTPASVHFFIGLVLKPEPGDGGGGGSSSAGGGGGGWPPRLLGGAAGRRVPGEGGAPVEVVFPSLRPRLALLRQVFQQLQPLLSADLESVARGRDPATPPATPAG